MSERESYESRIADLKQLKRFVSHYQPINGETDEPCSTDNDSVSQDHTENTQRSDMSALNGLKDDQAGMIWGPNGTLLGRVQDNGLAKPEELLGHPLNEKAEVLDETGQNIGQALAHETSAHTSFRSAREDPLYKAKPDANGRYHCPYDDSEGCWYTPQKLKFKFEQVKSGKSLPTNANRSLSEHLDTHLKPYRCNFGKCVDTRFSSTGHLLRHQSEAHNMHGYEAKPHLIHTHNGIDYSQETTTSSFSNSPPHGDAATHKIHGASQNPPVRHFDDFFSKPFGGKENASERVEGAHVLAPPATVYGRTTFPESNDSVRRKGVGFFDTPPEPKFTVPSGPPYDPKVTTFPSIMNLEQVKDDQSKFVVDLDVLLRLEMKINNLESRSLPRLESKINDLESRVDECEDRPGFSSNSSISDSQDSEDSVSDLDRRSIREVRDPRHFNDEIIIIEPKGKKEKRDAVIVEGPSLTLARRKCFNDIPRIEIGIEELPPRYADDKSGNRPLLGLTEEFAYNGKLWRKRLEIASPPFYELLREVSGHNISDIAIQDNVFHLMEPFMVLFLNRKQLADYVESTNGFTPAKEHARFILNFLKSDFGDVSRMLDNFESMTPPNLVKYCDLWMLYRPGTTVYSRANGEWEAFVIDSLDGMQIRKPSYDNRHALTRLDIRAWSMNFDGEVYGRVWSIHCVAPFHGVRDISSLPLVPEKSLLDGKTIRESLLSRGKKFCSLQEQHCEASNIHPSQSTRVMVDHLTYQRRTGWLISIDGKYGPSSAKDRSWTEDRYSDWDKTVEAFDRVPRRHTPQRSLVRHFENEYLYRDYRLESIYTPEDTQAEECRSYSSDRPSHVVVCEFEKYNLVRSATEMDELSLILCPQHVRGFSFYDKVWKFYNVSQLKLASFQENAWDRLILDEEYKDMLETVVSCHVDVVAGLRDSAAGKGLSILLHGEPGVGKTLTAESIAEHLGKPFFPVTCSDVGTSVSNFEAKLEEISDYATRWGAILLFDEADVLLQARCDYEYSNLKRHDLVSSFVEFIEYHQGIVFITTSRVTRFDGVLIPRIDVTIGLPPLDRGRRVAIWRNQIQDSIEEGCISGPQSADLHMLAQEKWSNENLNGHQIKKAVRTARVLAQKRRKMMGSREIETMLKMEREFQERVGHSGREKENKAGVKKDKEDLEGFEQVEKP